MNLTNSYMESLAKIHAPSSDTKNLRKFDDLCEANIRGLETLGVMTESYGSLLIPILLKKIPEDIRRLIFRADPLVDSSLDILRVAIRQEIETRENGHISSLEFSLEFLGRRIIRTNRWRSTNQCSAKTKISKLKTESITTMHLRRGNTPPREM